MTAQQTTVHIHDLWGIAADPAEAPITTVCEYHADRRAQGTCSECGAPICLECLITVDHKPVCPVCGRASCTGEMPPLTTDDVVLRYSGTPHPVAARWQLGKVLNSFGFPAARGRL